MGYREPFTEERAENFVTKFDPSLDYYAILGVPPDADATVIKRAYRKASFAYHPDRNPNNPEAEARFKAVANAKDVLSNATARRQYDQLRNRPFRPSHRTRTEPVPEPPPTESQLSQEQKIRNFLNGTFFASHFAGAMKVRGNQTLMARSVLRQDLDSLCSGFSPAKRASFMERYEALAQECCVKYVEDFLTEDAFTMVFANAMYSWGKDKISIMVEIRRKFEAVVQGLNRESQAQFREQFKAMLAQAIKAKFGEDD